MATAKPAILSNNFFRAVRSCRPQTHRSIRSQPSPACCRNKLHTSSRRLQQESRYERYGSAATPGMPPPPKPLEPFLPSTDQTQQDASKLELKKAERKEKETQETASDPGKEDQQATETQTETRTEAVKEDEQADPQPEDALRKTSEGRKSPVEPSQVQGQGQGQGQTQASPAPSPPPAEQPPEFLDSPLGNKELDMVLSIPSPSELKGSSTGNGSQHPHLEASPYEHHFDTYSLVQDLSNASPNPADPSAHPEKSFTPDQAITLMKAIRLMLAENLDLAKDGLVSKSDTENETYLFRAACSELKTTMQTSRFMEAQKQRSQRAQLQHEFDILNQKVSQDIMSVREELKGMFNDRKLGLQEEKRQIDGKIQSLGYKISVDLNSEAKSNVEGLRWVLTRRAALALLAAASMIISFLQYSSVQARKQAEIEKKRQAVKQADEDRIKKEQERFGSGGSGVTIGRSTGTQTDGIVLGGTAGGSYEESLG